MKVFARNILLCGFAILLFVSCATNKPDNASNVCSVFTQYPKWYWSALDSQKKWGIPISIMMAIIYQESSYTSDAKPPREEIFGFIPWTRPTSAFGYCQATDDSWRWYKKQNGNYSANRDDFVTAIDFIGFYSDQAHKIAGISKNDAYGLYLAYHEGISGYKKKTYLQKQWLMKVAHKVENRAMLYHKQLMQCKNELPQSRHWW